MSRIQCNSKTKQKRQDDRKVTLRQLSVVSFAKKGSICTCSKIHSTAIVFPLTPILTLTQTLNHNNIFGLTKWRHFSSQCASTAKWMCSRFFFLANNNILALVLLLNLIEKAIFFAYGFNCSFHFKADSTIRPHFSTHLRWSVRWITFILVKSSIGISSRRISYSIVTVTSSSLILAFRKKLPTGYDVWVLIFYLKSNNWAIMMPIRPKYLKLRLTFFACWVFDFLCYMFRLKGRMHCFSLQVVMNNCFLLNWCRSVLLFSRKTHTLIPKNYVTEPKAILITS